MEEIVRAVFAGPFNQVVALLLLAMGIGIIAVRLHQPLIVAFIVVGILAGPSGFGWVSVSEEIRLLAEIGLSLLLFVVGLRLDLGLIRSMGLMFLAAGLGQVVLTSIIGYLVAITLGMPPLTAVYVSVALTLSSTVVVIKLLSDKRETDSLHGRIAVGILIIQDIVVILAMIGMTASAAGDSGPGVWSGALLIVIKGFSLLIGIGIMMYLVLPKALTSLARSPELLVLSSIAWALAVSSISGALGLSREVGAFLAGVSLASTSYREMIGARLVSLRDFLLLFFFIDLGMGLDISALSGQVWKTLVLCLFVLIGDPLIIMSIMGLLGYRRRTSFLSGLMLSQVSEFSLILATLGLRLGHIGADTVALITLVALITIGVSTYMIQYSDVIYDRLCSHLFVFERRTKQREEYVDVCSALEFQPYAILFGLGRYGTSIARSLSMRSHRVYGVDFDPEAVRRWKERGWNASFGDAEDPEFPAMLPLSCSRWVISSLADRHINVVLLRALQSSGFGGSIAVTAATSDDAEKLKAQGADVVFLPSSDAASQAVEIVEAVDEQERRRKMDERIAGLSEHYVICGYGRMGQQIGKDLGVKGVPFVVIENNPIQIPRLKDENTPYVEGNASEDRAQKAAGIERAKGLIAVNPTDEENVFIVLTARGLNSRLFIVARSILRENEDKLRRAGADRVISPYVLGGHRMAQAVLNPRSMEFLDMLTEYDHNDMELADIKVTPDSQLAGRTIRECGLRDSSGVLILAIGRANGEKITNPKADVVIDVDDELIVMGSSEEIDVAERLAKG